MLIAASISHSLGHKLRPMKIKAVCTTNVVPVPMNSLLGQRYTIAVDIIYYFACRKIHVPTYITAIISFTMVLTDFVKQICTRVLIKKGDSTFFVYPPVVEIRHLAN